MANQYRFYLLIAALMFPATGSEADTVLNFKIGEVSYDAVCAADSYYAADDGPCHICYSTETSLGEECDANDRECIINAVIAQDSCNSMICNRQETDAWQIHYGGDVANSWNDEGHYTCDDIEGWFYEDGPISTCDSSNCESSAWTSYGTGYQKRTYRYCASSTECASTEQYRCAKDYYGSSTNGATGCTKCDNSPDKNTNTGQTEAGLTAAADTKARTSCYIPALGGSDAYIDSTGTYDFSSNCYWG